MKWIECCCGQTNQGGAESLELHNCVAMMASLPYSGSLLHVSAGDSKWIEFVIFCDLYELIVLRPRLEK